MITITKEFIMEKLGTEINLIQNEIIRELVIKALLNVKEAFFIEDASSTGKYHPSYAQGEGGLLRHTQAAVYFANIMLELEMSNIKSDSKDMIIAALILHDTCKRGINWDNKYTQDDHPILVEKLLDIDSLDIYEYMYWEDINYYISAHMGEWNKIRNSKELLPKPQSQEQKIVHLCDYLASRKVIDLKIFNDSYETSIVTPQIKEASRAQKNYFCVLRNQARKIKGYNKNYDDLEAEDLTQGQAGKLISELKLLID